MAEIIKIKTKNHVYVQLDCDTGIKYEIKEHFTFEVPNARFHPKVKMKVWDGKISLFNLTTGTLPSGLYDPLVEFCKARDYILEPVESHYGIPGEKHSILPEDLVEYTKSLNISLNGENIEVRDYQYAAIYKAIKNCRQTVVSPTGSGKSLIIYIISRYLLDNDVDNILIVVPTTSLVLQLSNDFIDYSAKNDFDAENEIHQIMSGKEKHSNRRITISTWQSISKLPSTFFLKYQFVAIDECHLAAALELQKLLDKCTEAKFRMGFTGSLSNSKTNTMQIQGMLGPVIKVTETKKLMEEGHLSEINIKCVTLNYSKDTKALVSKNKDYQKEIDFIVQHTRRNKFIRNLALSLDGNTLILYNFVEKHGDVLDMLFKEKIGERNYFYIHGGVDADERDELRPIVEQSNNAIILASYGTFSTGVNIKRLHNIVLASPTKSVVRVLQSIGRGLRKGNDKSELILYDISDDLSNSKSKKNFTYRHFVERLKIYSQEQFDYAITTMDIE